MQAKETLQVFDRKVELYKILKKLTICFNRIATIENEHFNAIQDGVSRYYGTVWRENAENIRIYTRRVSKIFK